MNGPGGDPAANVVDARGRRCPVPVIELAKLVATLPAGSTAGVLADDPAARIDVPAWCRLRGHDYLGAEPADGGGSLYVVRTTG